MKSIHYLIIGVFIAIAGLIMTLLDNRINTESIFVVAVGILIIAYSIYTIRHD
jgi:hypothetical protein